MRADVRSEDGFLLPVGTVTLLLADIEGSSRLWEADRDAMTHSVARFDELVEEIVGRYGGVRPLDQGEGDSFLSAFSRPSDALSCALAIQRTFETEPWGPAPIRVRIALHTGEVQMRDEVNYVGDTVNRCSRIRDVAHGGQTLVSQATYELVRDRLPEGATLKDLGTHRLKDLARPEHIYQLGHPDLVEDFAPLRSLDAHPNNLPVQLTSFVGRAAEIDEVRTLLSGSRVLTLTGSGGSGKTRLALQVAADSLGNFPDGVWIVDLSMIRDTAAVGRAIGAVLRVREQPHRDVVDDVAREIGDKRVLLVIDNCEHLVERCAEIVEALLKSCPALVVMATSREPLSVPGETPWRVPSMTLPDEKHPPRIEALTQFDAVKLFIERALRTRPNFRVTNETAPAVAQICHRLDGIPLAIELAAARVRVLTPQQIVDGLNDRFHLLTGGSRIAVPRQQTLQASVDWSHDLLSEDERAVLRRLSVFAGGCTLDLAEDVCSDDVIEKSRILDLLSNLVDKSLVIADDEGAEVRYRLLETIREYARDRLSTAGETEAIRTRHRDAFLALVEDADKRMEGRQQNAWFSLLRSEHGNILQALEWSKHRAEYEELQRIAASLVFFWTSTWLNDDGRTWLRESVANGPTEASEARGRVLAGLGFIELTSRNFAAVPELANEAANIFDEIGLPAGKAWTTCMMGWMSAVVGDNVAAASFFEESLGQAKSALASAEVGTKREGELLWPLAFALEGLGTTNLDRPTVARGYYEQALDTATRSGAHDLVRRNKIQLGWAEYLLGHYSEAASLLTQVSEEARSSADVGQQAWALSQLGWALLWMGDYEGAKHSFEAAIDLAPPIIAGFHNPWNRIGLAQIALEEQDDSKAACDLIAEVLDETSWAREGILAFLARAEIAAGRTDQAREHLDEAMAADVHGYRGWLAGLKALLELSEGNLRAAEELVYHCWGAAPDGPRPPTVAEGLEILALVAANTDRCEDAARLFGAAASVRSLWVYPRAHWVERIVGPARYVAQAELGSAAFDVAMEEGAAMSMEEAVAYARRGRGERKRPAAGWDSLTPTEIQVVGLIREGLSNPQIAERMFVSRSTVKFHLSQIYAKLGFSSRAELAAEAARREAEASSR